MKISPIFTQQYILRQADNSSFQRNKDNNVSNFELPMYKFPPSNINFGYNFVLKYNDNIPCAYCGKDMLNKNAIYSLLDLKGEALAAELKKYVSQKPSAMTEQRYKAYSNILGTILSNPDKNGKDILAVAYMRARNRMLLKQAGLYSDIITLAKSINCQELIDYINSVKEQDAVIDPNISIHELANFLEHKLHIQFRRTVIRQINLILKNAMNNDNLEICNRIKDMAHSLPSSKSDADAYLVKYISKALRKDPKIEEGEFSLEDDEAVLFYAKLLQPFLSTSEHVKPHVDNGADDFSNYLVVHQHCNLKRGSIPFSQYMLSNPKILNYILKNLSYIAENKDTTLKTLGFKSSDYLRLIKDRLKTELETCKDNPDISAFLAELDEITYLPSALLLTLPDETVSSRTIEALEKTFSIKDKAEQAKALDELYKMCIDIYNRARKRKIANVMCHYTRSTDPEIMDYLKDMKNKDFFADCSTQADEILNIAISDSFIRNYRESMICELFQLLKKSNCEYPLSEAETIAKKLAIKKTPELCCIKILLNSKNPDGNYDIQKISSYLTSGCVS